MRFSLLDIWDEAETKGFALNDYFGVGVTEVDGEAIDATDVIFTEKFGDLPILFTAPHATKHVRDGGVKEEDKGTGGLAEVLARHTGGRFIAMAGNQTSDANHDKIHPFKDEIKKWAGEGYRILIDLHGIGVATSEETGAHIGVGLGPNPSPASGFLARAIKIRGKRDGIEVRVGNSKFAALRTNGITATATRYGLYAVQLEMAPHFRFGENNDLTRWSAVKLIAHVASDAAMMVPELDKLLHVAELAG